MGEGAVRRHILDIGIEHSGDIRQIRGEHTGNLLQPDLPECRIDTVQTAIHLFACDFQICAIIASLKGKLLGEISVDGTTGNPDIQGYLQMDSANMFVEMANTTVRFDSKEIGIYDKKIWFNKYKLFASGENPFVINGAVDFSDMSNMTADLKLNARNMQLLNAKRTKQSWVYGKMFVNWNSTVKVGSGLFHFI